MRFLALVQQILRKHFVGIRRSVPVLYSLPQPVFHVSSMSGTVLDSGDKADTVSVQRSGKSWC